MLQNLTGWHALILLAVVLLVFGAAKLPALAKSVGQSVRILTSSPTRSSTCCERPCSSSPSHATRPSTTTA
jgi:sec-independent protein translocase protein TatA